MIETDRLILRELLPTDIDSMFELDSDPIVHKYLGNRPVKTKHETEKIIQSIIDQYKDRGIGRWAAIEKSTGDFIGWSGLKLNIGEKDSLNGKQNFYDIGYRFIPRYWGKGYATESAIAALDFGFKVKQYQTIAGIALVENIGSNKVLQKIGLRYIEDFDCEGTRASWYELALDDYKKNLKIKQSKKYDQDKKEKRRIYINEKYQNDEKYRKKVKKYYREKYNEDEEYKKNTLNNAKRRYHEDEEYRKKTIERAKARYKKNKKS
ncbi:MAG: GNAT family N-acetyltransferase [Flavobacteriaceae bacterium]